MILPLALLIVLFFSYKIPFFFLTHRFMTAVDLLTSSHEEEADDVVLGLPFQSEKDNQKDQVSCIESDMQ